MALSDYDSILFDNDGKCVVGPFKFKNGTNISTRKDYLYIENHKVWKLFEKQGFSYPTVGQIDEGHIHFLGVDITVMPIELKDKRGIPYGTVKFFYCRQGWGKTLKQFGGILCYGHLDLVSYEVQQRGLDKKYPNYSWTEMSSHDGDEDYSALCGLPSHSTPKSKMVEIRLPKGWGKLSNSWRGVTKDMIIAFLKWGVPEKDWLKKVAKSKKLSYNQGDLFFAAALKTKLNVSTSRKKSRPVMHRILDSWKSSQTCKPA